MNPSIPNPEKIEQLQTLTRRYSSLVNNAAGLAYVVAGVFFVSTYFATEALKLETLPKLFFCLLIFMGWIPIRNYFRANYYQTLGIVKESKTPWKPKPDPKRKLKLAITFLVWFVFLLVIPTMAFVRLESVTPERLLFFGLYLLATFGFGYYLAKSRIDTSLIMPALGFLAIGLNDFDFIFESRNREGNLVYNLLAVAAFMAFIGIFEHIRYQRVTKEIIELQRSL